MPAAAVIPAPRAYTDIAAVKTLVVGCWAQVCWVAGGPVCPGLGGSGSPARCGLVSLELNPQWYAPVPDLP